MRIVPAEAAVRMPRLAKFASMDSQAIAVAGGEAT